MLSNQTPAQIKQKYDDLVAENARLTAANKILEDGMTSIRGEVRDIRAGLREQEVVAGVVDNSFYVIDDTAEQALEQAKAVLGGK